MNLPFFLKLVTVSGFPSSSATSALVWPTTMLGLPSSGRREVVINGSVKAEGVGSGLMGSGLTCPVAATAMHEATDNNLRTGDRLDTPY